MKFLSAYELKAEYLDSGNFELLLESEINLRDNYNNTALMFLC